MAEALEGFHRDQLDRVYAGQQTGETRQAQFKVLAALVVLLLAGVQLFLLGQTRRLVNPPLLGATVVALAFLAMLGRSLELSTQLLRVADEESFASIHALLRARTLSYDARGEESRSLLDPPRAGAEQDSFSSKMREVTTGIPPGQGLLEQGLRRRRGRAFLRPWRKKGSPARAAIPP